MSQLGKLTTNDILEKEFRSEIRGYSQSEVDEYLDLIIQDYQMFEKEITRLRKENQALHRDLNTAQQRAQAVVPAPAAPVVPATTRTESTQFTNYDVIKRVAQLERQVAEIQKQLQAEPQAQPQVATVESTTVPAEQPLTAAEIEKTLQFTFTK